MFYISPLNRKLMWWDLSSVAFPPESHAIEKCIASQSIGLEKMLLTSKVKENYVLLTSLSSA